MLYLIPNECPHGVSKVVLYLSQSDARGQQSPTVFEPVRPLTSSDTCTGPETVSWESGAAWSVAGETLRDHQRPPETTRDHQRPPETIRDHLVGVRRSLVGRWRDHQRPLETTRDHLVGVSAAWSVAGETIRDHQRPSETIRDHQRPPETTRDHQRPPGGSQRSLIGRWRDHQRPPETIRDHQRLSETTRDHLMGVRHSLVGRWRDHQRPLETTWWEAGTAWSVAGETIRDH